MTLDDILKFGAKTVLAMEFVSDAEASRRMAICQSCDNFDPVHIKCKQCGCFLEVKVACKTNRSPARPNGELTHCPNGFWGDIDIANHYRALDGLEPLNTNAHVPTHPRP
jgi:hypothetical protein